MKRYTILALCHWIGITFLFQTIMFPPLAQYETKMSHLDPSDIISKPMETHFIFQIVVLALLQCLLLTTLSTLLCSKTTTLLPTTMTTTTTTTTTTTLQLLLYPASVFMISTLLGGIIVFVCAVLCGASPVPNSTTQTTQTHNHTYPVVLTFLGSIFFAGICFSPLCLLSWIRYNQEYSKNVVPPQTKPNTNTNTTTTTKTKTNTKTNTNTTIKTQHQIQIECLLFLLESMLGKHIVDPTTSSSSSSTSNNNYNNNYNNNNIVLTEKEPTIVWFSSLFGMIASMILIPLDWGAQIQRWPIPMLVGTWIGLGMGVFVCLLVEGTQRLIASFSPKVKQ